MNIRRTLSWLGILFLTSCGGGGGGGDGGGTPQHTYRVLNLNTGVLGPPVSSVASNANLFTNLLVLVQIPAGTFAPGQAVGTLGQQADETPGGVVAVATFWMAAHELTQGQWLTLVGDGSRPWLQIGPAAVVGGQAEADGLPAHGLSQDQALATLATFAVKGGAVLSLPSELQWEWACRAGGTGLFSWGDSLDPAVVAAHAVTGAGVSAGPALVGLHQVNAYGLYDMHGNVREWTSDGTLRGGGWSDHPLRCRSANRVTGIDPSTAHAGSGLRPVLVE